MRKSPTLTLTLNPNPDPKKRLLSLLYSCIPVRTRCSNNKSCIVFFHGLRAVSKSVSVLSQPASVLA